MGPQHPSTHGVFRLNLRIDGETIVGLKPVMGYMHRNHEKIGERNTFLMNFPFTDRLDYLTSMGNNFGYALAVEQLMGDDAKPPERAEYIRVIMAELTRIASHMWSIGFLLNDLGAFFTPALYAIEERELILDLFEWAAGSRMMCNYFRFGGVAFDLPPGWIERCRGIVNDRLDKKIDELDRYLSQNEIVLDRAKGVGILTREQAINYSTAGPVLRASGVDYDIRTRGAVRHLRPVPVQRHHRQERRPLRPVLRPAAGDAGERPHPQAGRRRHPRRPDPPRQEELPDQGARRRGVFPGREPQGRAGLLRGRRRLRDRLSLPRPQPELHQPDGARGHVPGPHHRRRRRHPRQPRYRAGRGGSVSGLAGIAGTIVMAYSDFTLESRLPRFLAGPRNDAWICSLSTVLPVPSVHSSLLDEYVPLATSIHTEKARSEFIIAPILAEVRRLMDRRISLFSGMDFDVDPAQGLSGICDFILRHSHHQLFLTGPVLMIVEAKNEQYQGRAGPVCRRDVAGALQ